MMSEGFSANGRRDGEVVDGGVEDRDGWDSSATPHYPLISSFLMCGGLILMAVACYCARGGRPQRPTTWGSLGWAPRTSHQLATERRVPAPGATKYLWEMIGRLDWAWATNEEVCPST